MTPNNGGDSSKIDVFNIVPLFLLGYPQADLFELGRHFLDYTSNEYIVRYCKKTGFAGRGLKPELKDALNCMLRMGFIEVKPITTVLGAHFIYGRFDPARTSRLWKRIEFEPPLTISLTHVGRRFANQLDQEVVAENDRRWRAVNIPEPSLPPKPVTRESLIRKLAGGDFGAR